MSFSTLPLEVRKEILKILLAPQDGLQSVFGPHRSPFNITLAPLLVNRQWWEDGISVFQESTFAKFNYPSPGWESTFVTVATKVKHLRFDAELSDQMNWTGTLYNGPFVRFCKEFSKRVGHKQFHSITIVLEDLRERDVEDEVADLCTALCQGLQLFRAKMVRTKNLPQRIDACLHAELVSSRPPPTEFTAMISCLDGLCQSVESSCGVPAMSDVWKNFTLARRALTQEDFLIHRQDCIEAIRRIPGLDSVFEVMISNLDDSDDSDE